MKHSSLTVLLGTQRYSLFLLLDTWWQGSHLSSLSRGVVRAGKGMTSWISWLIGWVVRAYSPEELNYVEEDSSRKLCGCWGWCSAGGSWGGKSFCMRPSSWSVEIPALATVSGTWKRKAAIKTEAWWRHKCHLSGFCLPLPQQESYHWSLNWHHCCYNCRQGKIFSNTHKYIGWQDVTQTSIRAN